MTTYAFRQRDDYRTAVLREAALRAAGGGVAAPEKWREWLPLLFPRTFTAEFAPRQVEFWDWIDAIEPDEKPEPSAFFAIWPRESGKTTSAETAVCRVGARQSRNFVLYVRGTQDKANQSVQNIASKLESREIERYHPKLASRKMGKYGHSRGWRMDMLRTDSDFNVLALGLDAAVRGVKLDDYRPDLIIFDDIDAKHDTPKTIQKKIDIITTSIIPAGAKHCAYLGVQNLIHALSIFNTIVEGEADFLHDRHVSGPHPAIVDLAYESKPEGGYRITGGRATWEAGQSLATCEKQINEWGLTSFLQEAQHEVEESGGVWEHIEFRRVEYDALPDFVDGQVWCDPAVTSTDDSDNNGIAAGGIDSDGKIYMVYGDERIDSPVGVIKRAILKAIEFGFSVVGIETDQGGDTWVSVYHQAWQEIVNGEDVSYIISIETAVADTEIDTSGYNEQELKRADAFIFRDGDWQLLKRPKYKYAKAGAGHGSKVERNQRMLSDYELGRVLHVLGTHTATERALKRFPNKPLDLADAWYWCWWHLAKRRRKSRIL